MSGLEWNVRVSGARNPDVIDKVGAVFESYWNGADFVPYDAKRFAAQVERADKKGSVLLLSPLEIRPEPFQPRPRRVGEAAQRAAEAAEQLGEAGRVWQHDAERPCRRARFSKAPGRVWNCGGWAGDPGRWGPHARTIRAGAAGRRLLRSTYEHV